MFGHVAGAAADSIPQHLDLGDGAGLRVDIHLELGSAEVGGKLSDERVVVGDVLAAGDAEAGFGEGAEGLGGNASHAHSLQPAAQLAGQAAGEPGFAVDRGDDGLGAGHAGDIGEELSHTLMLCEGEEEIGGWQGGRQVILGIVDDQGESAGRLPGFDGPGGGPAQAQVGHVPIAVLPRDYRQYSHR